MKKTIYALLITLFFAINSCSVVDDVNESFDALKCANLIKEVDERFEREDRNCSNIRADVNSILNTCRDFLDEEQIANLEFYAANCDVDN